MKHHKASVPGREERRRALSRSFPELHVIEKSGRDQGVPVEDISYQCKKPDYDNDDN